MYLGALHAFATTTNPDRIAQTAQSARELMEKLPRRLGTEQARRGNLKQQAQDLQTVWERYRGQVDTPTSELLGKTIDRPLLPVLLKVEEVVGWLERFAPGRKAEARVALREIDISGVDLPEHLIEENVNEWLRLRGFFDSAAHHGRTVSDADMERELAVLERFLSDRLIPETTEDLEAIDRILGGGDA